MAPSKLLLITLELNRAISTTGLDTVQDACEDEGLFPSTSRFLLFHIYKQNLESRHKTGIMQNDMHICLFFVVFITILLFVTLLFYDVVVVTRPLGGMAKDQSQKPGNFPGFGPEVVKRQRVAKERAAQRVRSWTAQNEMRGVLGRVSARVAGRILDSANPREIRT